ncbi:thioredoxin TrxA [Buchnera aphidicola (Taiwanaphis decaspermi)]|uniref:thioredoxin TrxA n=1 Tax=Buchnera aphidicola TaxID=9 RepID=UPI0031B853B9
MKENKILKITDNNFEKFLSTTENFILVDFWAEWCEPCKILSPILDEISKEYKTNLIICKMNVDENPLTPPKYSIRGIPSLLLFKNGELLATKVGSISKRKLKDFLNDNL